jgi:hypothetical protein
MGYDINLPLYKKRSEGGAPCAFFLLVERDSLKIYINAEN